MHTISALLPDESAQTIKPIATAAHLDIAFTNRQAQRATTSKRLLHFSSALVENLAIPKVQIAP